jgi:hypothetical protein
MGGALGWRRVNVVMATTVVSAAALRVSKREIGESESGRERMDSLPLFGTVARPSTGIWPPRGARSLRPISHYRPI